MATQLAVKLNDQQSTLERFDTPLPEYLKCIRAETYWKIGGSHFAKLLYQGDEKALRAMMLGLWPFVNEFPSIVGGAKRQVAGLRRCFGSEMVMVLVWRGIG